MARERRRASRYGRSRNRSGSTRVDEARLGRPQGAIADFDEAIRIDPNVAKAYQLRGKACFLLGELDQAFADATTAIGLDPTMAAYNTRASVRRTHKDSEGAITDCTDALMLDRKYAEALYNRGNARAEAGDRRAALIDYTAAINADPQNGLYYYVRASLRSNLDDSRGAREDFATADRLGFPASLR